MLETINNAVLKYGWSAIEQDRTTFKLFNRNDLMVCMVYILQKNKYKITDRENNVLLTGINQLKTSLDKVLTQYFYAALL